MDHPKFVKYVDDVLLFFSQCKQNGGVEFSKLALHWCLRQEGIASTLISVASLSFLEWNLAAVSEALTEEEEKALTEIDENHFKPLKTADRNWLQTEVVRYWTTMKDENAEQPMDC